MKSKPQVERESQQTEDLNLVDRAIYVDDDMDLPSDSDDEDEGMDCVHEIFNKVNPVEYPM